MTKYTAKGKLVEIGETREFASGFATRRFIVDVTENPNYPSPVEFTLKKEHTGDIEGYQPGEAVAVDFTLDGRRWDGPNGPRYFCDHTAWKLERAGGTVTAAAPAAATTAQAAGGASMQQAVATWKKYHGDDKAGFGAFCKTIKPGKKSSEYTSADWGEIVAKLEYDAKAVEAEQSGGDDFENLPF